MRNLAATATACSADADGSYTGCTVAVLQAPPYDFVGTDGVTCTGGTIDADSWGATCRHGLLPVGQSASFSTGRYWRCQLHSHGDAHGR